MIKKLFILVILISLNAFSHTVKDGDMDGAWRAIEVFINGEKQENIDTVMVASDGYSSWRAQEPCACAASPCHRHRSEVQGGSLHSLS